MYGPPRVIERHIDWPYICGVCGKKLPTSKCIPKNQSGDRPKPQLKLWCDFHKRWGTKSIENCFKKIQHMQEQALGNTPQAQMDGDKAILVLDRQPLLWKTVPVQIVNQDEVYNKERALVPISPFTTVRIKPTYQMRDLQISWSRTNGEFL